MSTKKQNDIIPFKASDCYTSQSWKPVAVLALIKDFKVAEQSFQVPMSNSPLPVF